MVAMVAGVSQDNFRGVISSSCTYTSRVYHQQLMLNSINHIILDHSLTKQTDSSTTLDATSSTYLQTKLKIIY